MTQPLYAPRPGQTRVLTEGHIEQMGTGADIAETVGYLRWRIVTLRWEDIDPDTNPTCPPKPHFSWRHHETSIGARLDIPGPWLREELDQENLEALRIWRKQYLEWEAEFEGRPGVTLAPPPEPVRIERRPAQPVAQHRVYLLAENFDRLMRWADDEVRVQNGHWFASSDGVVLLSSGGRAQKVSSHIASWVLEHGAFSTRLAIRRTCRRSWCVNPDHLIRRSR